jgi:hypothetical protein
VTVVILCFWKKCRGGQSSAFARARKPKARPKSPKIDRWLLSRPLLVSTLVVFFLKFYPYKDRGTWAALNICFAQHATNKHKHLEKNRRIASVQASLCLPIFVPSSSPCDVVCVLNVPGIKRKLCLTVLRGQRLLPCPKAQALTKWYS